MLVHTGTFDVENYGDLLFPALLRHRLPQSSLLHVSPTGSLPIWEDTEACEPLDAAVLQPLGGIIIGGGNIIHPMPTTLPEYRRMGLDLGAYADLWLVPAIAADQGVPIIWNGPGVPDYFETAFLPLVREALERADYLSVRDAESQDFLAELVTDKEIAVVPDPAWDLPALWSPVDLATTRKTTIERLGGDPAERYFVVHVNARYTSELPPDALASEIDGMSRALSAVPVLVAIGPCHGDGATVSRLASELSTSPLVLHSPRRIKDIAAIIAGAEAYVGSSMHGYITAAAFGVPAIAIARGKSKFLGLARRVSAPETILESWLGACDTLCAMDHTELSRLFQTTQAEATAVLDDHWRNIRSHLETASAKKNLGGIESVSIAKARSRVLSAQVRHFQGVNFEHVEFLARVTPARIPSAPLNADLWRATGQYANHDRTPNDPIEKTTSSSDPINAPPRESHTKGSGDYISLTTKDLDKIFSSRTYDYIDFGCSKGGSLTYGREVLGGTRGIGLDIAPEKVRQTRAAGFAAAEVDVTQLISQPNCTRFATMIDFLEHLPGIDMAEKCIRAACEVATDFVFIRQPWFDSDGFLFSHGLKLYWSDWRGHPNAMTALELHRILTKLVKPKRWRIYARTIISDSADKAVHPLSSPPDQHDYDRAVHHSKPEVVFNSLVYRQIGAIVLLKDDLDLLEEIEKKTKWTKVLYDSI